MGIFDRFRRKKVEQKALPKGHPQHPEHPAAIISRELDEIQSVVAVLVREGRTNDADMAIADYLHRYERDSLNDFASPKECALVCYRLCYNILPGMVHNQWSAFLSLWKRRFLVKDYLALLAAGVEGKRLNTEQLDQFHQMQGTLSDGETEYYLFQFPVPPPQEKKVSVDVMLEQIAKGESPSIETRPVLGPYYAVIVCDSEKDKRHLFILGQSPDNRYTTVRKVSPGMNGNYGPGPDVGEVTRKAFLERVEELLK